ncbi:MAG: VWA domain-containing protein [Methanocorpusculum sp.]|nr:VWA domain-containing protein [Methanocorpusculum sp.]MDE2521992.1 VWA domain-containing protein [Methanocorpusculum sp.]MDE2523819.1 VWA domain-containing protein [Methanocorpusculum sp.]
MKTVLTLLVDCAGAFEGGRTAAANMPVKKFIAELPADLPVRILRYSDTAMWHLGPEPVPAGEVEWTDLPSGGYLSSLAHAVNLAGQSLTAAPDIRNVVLLISGGALSDPEEIVQTVLAKRFDASVIRAAVPLTTDADAAVLRMFAGDNVFDTSVLLDPRPLLSSFGESAAIAAVPHAAAIPITLSCTIDLGGGDSVSLSVSGTAISAVKEEMRSCLAAFGTEDEMVRKKIAGYVRRVF